MISGRSAYVADTHDDPQVGTSAAGGMDIEAKQEAGGIDTEVFFELRGSIQSSANPVYLLWP